MSLKKSSWQIWLAISAMLFCCPYFLYALPEVDSVVEGQAHLESPDPLTLNITTFNDRVVINYRRFNLAQNETVRFLQPAVSSSVLNRDLSAAASSIAGNLFSNGQIILINPYGINIGPQANIQVASIIASTLDIANTDFLNNRLEFTKVAALSNAYILNQGQIGVRNGGYVSLLAGAVENQAAIIAPLGNVVLASAEKVVLSLDDLGEINVVLAEPVKEVVFDWQGQRLDSAIKNSGSILAEGGRVILTAKLLNRVFDYAINNSGIIEAKSLVNHNGVIELVAEGAPIVNSGSLIAGELKVITDSDFINKGDIITKKADSANLPANIFIQAVNVLQGGLIFAEDKVDIEAETVTVILKDNPDTILLDPLVNVSPGVIIQANEVKIIAKQFGTTEAPLNIDAPLTYINRTQGNIDILNSLGIGTSILLRGPPDGFGAILYNKNSNLTLDAEKVTLVGPDPIYLYGNITYSNFECIIPDKEIYFEAGKTYTFKGNLSIIGAPDIGLDEFFVKLRSSEEGKFWYLDVQSSSYTLDKVNISDAYALSLVQIPEGVDAGNNVNLEIDPTWDGDGTTNNWSDAVNWSGNAVPTSSTDATFNATSTKDSIVDASFGGTVRDLLINAGYTGTIIFNRSLSVRDFSQAAGTVNLNGQTLTTSRDFDLSVGTFNAGSGSINVSRHFTISGTGSFNEGTSTVTFDGGNATINVNVSETFYNLTLNSTGTKIISSGDTLIVTGLLYLQNGTINTGTLEARGNVTVGSSFDGGNSPLRFTGGAAQNFDLTGATSRFNGNITIAKTAGTVVTLLSHLTMDQGGQDLTITSGTLNLSIYNLSVEDTLTLNGGTLIQGSGTITADNYNQTNGTFNGGSGDIDINGTFTLAGGTFTQGSAAITATDFTQTAGTFNGGSANIDVNDAFTLSGGTFTSTSGTLYIDGNWTHTAGGDFIHNNGTVVFDGSDANINVNVSETFYNLTFDANNNKTKTISSTLIIKGTLILKDGKVDTGTLQAEGDVTVNPSFDGGSAPLVFSGSAIQSFDLGGGGDDEFNADITVNKSGGQVNLLSLLDMDANNQDLIIEEGTFDLNGNNLIVNGSGSKLIVKDGGNLQLQGGETVTAKSGYPQFDSGSTVTYDGSGTYPSLKLGNTYSNLTFAGSGTFNLNAGLTINGNLNIGSGATLATNNLALTFGGNFVNNGTFTAGSSNITISGTGTQSIAGFTTTGGITVSKTDGTATFTGNVNGGDLTIEGSGGTLNLGAGLTHTFTGTWTRAAGTLNGGSSTLKIGGSVSGTGGIFTANTGTVEWNASGAQTIAGVTYNNLTLSGSGAKTFPTGTTTVNGILSMEGTATATITGTLNYGTTATLQYKGTATQTTGPELPATIPNLIVNNAKGVILSISPTITSTLTLTSGTFLITVTADPKSKTYGDADPALTYTITSGSLVAGDAFSGALTRVSDEDVGIYTITQGTLTAGSRYTITFVSAGFTINMQQATINQLSNAMLFRYPFPPSEQLGGYQFNPFIPMGPVYFYHPLTPIDMSAFEQFILEEDAYEFINKKINIIGHEGLLPLLKQ